MIVGKVLCPSDIGGILVILSYSYEKMELGLVQDSKPTHMEREEERKKDEEKEKVNEKNEK